MYGYFKDIVSALRSEASADDHRGAGGLCRDAANEIEKLHGATQWRDISTAPKDGTLIILWVEAIDKEDSCHPTENEIAWRTIGHNNLDHDGRDVWEFAGWCWQHDHWVQGDGTPTMWIPMPDRVVEAQSAA